MPFFSAMPLSPLQFLFSCQLLIAGIACYGQNENPLAVQLDKAFITSLNTLGFTNSSVQRVDSIGQTSEIAGHFCKIYSKTMKTVAFQLQDMDSGSKIFIEKFEIGFADYFLRAWDDDKKNNLSPVSEWKCFFSTPDAKPWQIVLLGVNAHTNIDIWQTLVNNFSEKEIRLYKKLMLTMQSSVSNIYYQFFDTLLAQNGYLRFINSVTMGFAKKFGEQIVYKWRRRNVKLAILFYQNKERFARKLAIVIRKKQMNDRKILRYKS